MSSKQQHKALAQQKRHRRQWITFVRMCRYGVNNFTRNAWLTIAATAVMTITLLIIFATFVAQNVLSDSVQQVSKRVDMSIYLENKTSERDANAIADDLRKLSNVETVTYVPPSAAREDFIEQNKSNPAALEALQSATNQFPGTLKITLHNINDTTQLDQFVKDNELLKKHISKDREPSFAGPRRAAIRSLASWTGFAQKVGFGASIVFVVISSLIVFNTIRMAIFNRKEEIQMMKLIGADKSFIRGPFVVEAIVYGVIAALLATGIGILILMLTVDGMSKYGIAVQNTLSFLTTYSPFVLLGMMALGAVIGIVSSLLATQRYLKI